MFAGTKAFSQKELVITFLTCAGKKSADRIFDCFLGGLYLLRKDHLKKLMSILRIQNLFLFCLYVL